EGAQGCAPTCPTVCTSRVGRLCCAARASPAGAPIITGRRLRPHCDRATLPVTGANAGSRHLKKSPVDIADEETRLVKPGGSLMRDSILYQGTHFSLLLTATLLAVACEEPGGPVHSAIGAVNLLQAGADTVGRLGTL